MKARSRQVLRTLHSKFFWGVQLIACFHIRRVSELSSWLVEAIRLNYSAFAVCREVEVRVRACRFRIPIAGVAELGSSPSAGNEISIAAER